MWRNIASNALTLLIVALVILGGVVAWGKHRFEAPGPLERAACIKVQRGTNFARLSEELAREGVIANPAIFRIGVQYDGRGGDLKAGSFLLRPGASMRDILDTVTRGGASTCGSEIVLRVGVKRSEVQLRAFDPASERLVTAGRFVPGEGDVPAAYGRLREDPDTRYRVTLAEGTTVWQVAQALGAVDFLRGELSELPPEGMMAPDSYEVTLGAARGDLVARMVEKQKQRLLEAWKTRADGLPYETPEEALTMASIIEKETGVASERPLVASVFINRLRRGMRLQTDPAVIYGVTGGKGNLGRGLRQSELRRKTPYNTYVVTGLPPTPIANPGIGAIEAALHPADTDYLYFVADGTGGHAFASTLAEHNRNVAAWRARQAAQEKGGN